MITQPKTTTKRISGNGAVGGEINSITLSGWVKNIICSSICPCRVTSPTHLHSRGIELVLQALVLQAESLHQEDRIGWDGWWGHLSSERGEKKNEISPSPYKYKYCTVVPVIKVMVLGAASKAA